MFCSAIHCAWGSWGEWTSCSKTCGDGNLTRQRAHAILSQYGGNNCTGSSLDTKHCNTQDDLRATIAQQGQTLKHKEQTIAQQGQTLTNKELTIASRDKTIAELKAQLSRIRR